MNKIAVLHPSAFRLPPSTLVWMAGIEPAWTCSQGKWVASTLHPEMLEPVVRIELTASVVPGLRSRAH